MSEIISDNYLDENISGGNEQSEKLKEAYKEKKAQSQKQAQKDQKQEQQIKANDYHISDFIVKLLQTRDKKILNYILNLLEHNVPSYFLVGIVSLVYADLKIEYLEKDIKFEYNFKNQELREWSKHLALQTFYDPSLVYENLIDIETWQIHKDLFELTEYIFRNKGFDEDLENINDFYQKLLKFLQTLI
jgi:hypothetical protein